MKDGERKLMVRRRGAMALAAVICLTALVGCGPKKSPSGKENKPSSSQTITGSQGSKSTGSKDTGNKDAGNKGAGGKDAGNKGTGQSGKTAPPTPKTPGVKG